MTRPVCHENAVVLAQVVDPGSFIDGIHFYVCTFLGCGKLWDAEDRSTEEVTQT